MDYDDITPSTNTNSNSHNHSVAASHPDSHSYSNPAKRPRITHDINEYIECNDRPIVPIQIGNDMYRLKLIYDTSEENHRQSQEKETLQSQFAKNKNIIAETKRLPIGDFIWILEAINGDNQRWIYPVMIERKRMDDLVKSIIDKRYNEQKWRMKRNLKILHLFISLKRNRLKMTKKKW